jgi:chromosomal replication initiation ATPase DnaA
MEAHLAHKERQLRMRMAARRVPIQLAPPPKPERLQRQEDAHVWAYRKHLAAEISADLPRVWVASIQSVICGEFRISREELVSAQRSQRICWPRQIAFYLCCKLTSRSLPEIGLRFGGKDHTTVLHGRDKVKDRLSFDLGFQGVLDDLELKCRDTTDFIGSFSRG